MTTPTPADVRAPTAAEQAAAIALAEATRALAIDFECPFCCFDPGIGQPHDTDCPVAIYEAAKGRPAAAVAPNSLYAPLFRCLRCGDPAADHHTDDEERRACSLCECTQYEAP